LQRAAHTNAAARRSHLRQADTRTRLIVTAMQLFWDKGYGSTSVADVLQAARVNSGSLYHFFPGKQDLLLAVLDMYHGGLRSRLLEPVWRGVTDPIELPTSRSLSWWAIAGRARSPTASANRSTCGIRRRGKRRPTAAAGNLQVRMPTTW
jgi:AcrR family transcriptional regulator